jgi:hypothetical protein
MMEIVRDTLRDSITCYNAILSVEIVRNAALCAHAETRKGAGRRPAVRKTEWYESGERDG